MTDTPEEVARIRQLLKELWELQNELGIDEDQLTMDEIVETTKQVRKERAEETMRQKLDSGEISEDEYWIEYGRRAERKRIIELLQDYGMFIHTKRAEILINGGTKWQPMNNS